MRVWGEKNICASYQQLSLQHQLQVGSDWLERRVDVIPRTARSAQNGEVCVQGRISMWSTPACLLSECVRVCVCVCVCMCVCVCVCVCVTQGLQANTPFCIGTTSCFILLFPLIVLSFDLFHTVPPGAVD